MTLLEAMVVLAVTGLIGTISYPRLEQAYRAFEQREAGQAVLLDLNRQRAAALAGAPLAGLRPLADGQGYRLLSDGTLHALPPGCVLVAPAEIRFLPDGSAVGGAVTLQGGAGAMALWVEPATGMVWRPAR